MALSPILGITQVATNQSNKETTINDAILALESAGHASLSMDYSTVSTGIWTLAETVFSRNFLFKAISAPSDRPQITLTLPRTINAHTVQRIFVVTNHSGAELTVQIGSATAGTTGATGVVIEDGKARLLGMDGDELFSASDATETSRFLDLLDTPGAYTGKAGMTFRVNETEDGLEFVEGLTISDLADVDTASAVDGNVLRYNGTSGEWEDAALNIVTTFLGLTDTPTSFAGKAGYLLQVNASNNAVEFLDPAGLGGPVTGGGNTGQVLTKQSATEGDYDWQDPHMLPAGGTAGQYLKKNSSDAYDAGWSDLPADELPSGGYKGQVLAKKSDDTQDVEWNDPAALVKRYTAGVVNSVAVSLLSGDYITLPFTPTVGNALIVFYYSNNAIVTSPSWSVLKTLAAQGSVWAGGVAVGKLVQAGDTLTIQPVTPSTADAAIVYEIDARYVRDGLTSLNIVMGYSDTAFPQITVAQPAVIVAAIAQRLGNIPVPTVTGATAELVANQSSSAGGNRYGAGFYVDCTEGAATIDASYILNGGTDGAYAYITMPAIDAAFEEAPVNYNTFLRRNKAWVQAPYHALTYPVGDEVTALTTGTAKATYRLPYAFRLVKLKASLSGASSSGIVTVDVKVNGTSILTTKLTIDAGEKTTASAAIPAVLSSTVFSDDAEVTIDVTTAGTNAKGLKVYFVGNPSV